MPEFHLLYKIFNIPNATGALFFPKFQLYHDCVAVKFGKFSVPENMFTEELLQRSFPDLIPGEKVDIPLWVVLINMQTKCKATIKYYTENLAAHQVANKLVLSSFRHRLEFLVDHKC